MTKKRAKARRGVGSKRKQRQVFKDRAALLTRPWRCLGCNTPNPQTYPACQSCLRPR